MGRSPKQGVDYFPHDTSASDRKTMFALESLWGNDGYAFWFKLLELLGSNSKCAIDCNDANEWYYMLHKMRMPEERVQAIIDKLAELQAIDRELWQTHRIIWSQNFVDRLEVLFKRRKEGGPKRPFTQAEKEDTVSKNDISANINPISANKNPFSASKTAISDAETDGPFGLTNEEIQQGRDRINAIIDTAERFGLGTHKGQLQKAECLADEYSLEWLLKAIERSGNGKEQTWRYVEGILKSWKAKGAPDEGTREEAQQAANAKALAEWGGSL